MSLAQSTFKSLSFSRTSVEIESSQCKSPLSRLTLSFNKAASSLHLPSTSSSSSKLRGHYSSPNHSSSILVHRVFDFTLNLSLLNIDFNRLAIFTPRVDLWMSLKCGSLTRWAKQGLIDNPDFALAVVDAFVSFSFIVIRFFWILKQTCGTKLWCTRHMCCHRRIHAERNLDICCVMLT